MLNRFKTRAGVVALGLLLAGAFAFANEAPTAAAGEDQVVAADENCEAAVTLDGSASTDPEGDALTFTWTGPFPGGATSVDGAVVEMVLGEGTFVFTLTVDDGQGNSASDDVSITVEDQTPPTIVSLTPSPSVLWPPNHKMIPIVLSADVVDNCSSGEDLTVTIASVSSNEPENGKGDGNHAPDWKITGDLTLQLRAERAGPGSGRIYTITVEASDAAGNTSSATAEVTVPHDQGGGSGDGEDDSSGALKVDFAKAQNNRLFLKLDVEDAVLTLPERRSGSLNDNVGLMDLDVDINGTVFTGTFLDNGRFKTGDFSSKLTANGRTLHVDIRNQDLATLLGLEPDAEGNFTVSVPVTATVTAPADPDDPAAEPVSTVLYDGTVDFGFKQKKGKGKGKSK
ncbi:MAG: PKD domain-containing protein [Planctomycetes bacterium]|nr:PKD domain-containing protein [Planctomycetota bacterium]